MLDKADASQSFVPCLERGNAQSDRAAVVSPELDSVQKKLSRNEELESTPKAETPEPQMKRSPSQVSRSKLRKVQTIGADTFEKRCSVKPAARQKRFHKSLTVRKASQLHVDTGQSLMDRRLKLNRLLRSKSQPHIPRQEFQDRSFLGPTKRSDSSDHIFVDLTKWRKAKQRVAIRRDGFPFSTKQVSLSSSGKEFAQSQSGDMVRRHGQNIDWLLLLPDAPFLRWWNVLIIALLIYTAYVMPYKISFIDNPGTAWFCIDLIIDCLFMTDVCINLDTAFYTPENVLVTSRSSIFWNYLQGWMILDIIASIPMDLVEMMLFGSGSAFSVKTLRLARLPRLYRLIRITRFVKISKVLKKTAVFDQMDEFFETNTGFGRLIMFIVAVLTFIHIVGCFWYYFAKLDDFNPDTWVVRFGFADSSNATLYLASIYWAFQTLLTVGYGDMGAFTTTELVIAILWMVFGAGAFSFTVGNLSSVLANFDSQSARLTLKMAQLNEFCKDARISSKLREELRASVEYTAQKGMFSWVEKQKIFSELPPQIKYEVAKQMHSGMINRVRFFRNKDSTFISLVVPLLQPYKAARKERIYTKDDHPTASKIRFAHRGVVYFLIEGKVAFIYDERIPFKEMVKGAYFGEGDILFQRKRLHTASALVDSQALTLSKQMFESLVIPEYPDIVEEMRKVAKERDKRFAESEQQMIKYIAAHCPNVQTIFDESENDAKRRRKYRRTARKENKTDRMDDELGSRSEASRSELGGSSTEFQGRTGIMDPTSAGTTPQMDERRRGSLFKTREGLDDRAHQTINSPREEVKVIPLVGDSGKHSSCKNYNKDEEDKSFPSAFKEPDTQLPVDSIMVGRATPKPGKARDSLKLPKNPLEGLREEDLEKKFPRKVSESSESSIISRNDNDRPANPLKRQLENMKKEILMNGEKQKASERDNEWVGVQREAGQDDGAAGRHAENDQCAIQQAGSAGAARLHPGRSLIAIICCDAH